MSSRPLDGVIARVNCIAATHAAADWRKIAIQETSTAVWSLATQMKLERENVTAPEFHAMDRQVIRVDVPDAHAGITAALRRAFEAAASEPTDRDFADLLRKLN